ncbi:MAG TPA: hypothetical protein PLK90_04175 [Clostridiales bacterium]|nr:hypothetical protein [Clostridiales bacterium]HQP69578.1 hypothetical protein [Clostridiales bacterium]
MLKRKKNTKRIQHANYYRIVKVVKCFVKTNWFHIIAIFFIACMIFLKNLTKDWSPIINVPCDTINYYWDILISLGISYTAGFIFYLLVVYFPEQQKRTNVETSLNTLFRTIQTNACKYLDETFKAFGYEFPATTNLKDTFSKNNLNNDPFKVLSNSITESDILNLYENTNNRYEIIIQTSSKILSCRDKLIPYIQYMNKDELICFSALEDIRIFDHISNLPKIGYYFYDTLDEVLDLIKKTEKILDSDFEYIAAYKNPEKEIYEILNTHV